ncbi:hypothetical protein GCM10029992_64470 [Glycomyces albus]
MLVVPGLLPGRPRPGPQDLTAAIRAAHHLNLAHGLSVAAIREHAGRARVGTAVIMTDVDPASDHPGDRAAALLSDGEGNRMFLDPLFKGLYPEDLKWQLRHTGGFDAVADGDLETIAAPLDFVGVNHYHHLRITADETDPLGTRALPPVGPVTSFGWEINPESLRKVLLRLRGEYTDLPVYVTENGASFDDRVGEDGEIDDAERVDYLAGYLRAAGRRSRRAWTCAATSCGRCWTTTSGPRATPSGSAWSTSTTGPRSARPNAARTGTAA